jgi:hypothetical protein
MDSVAWQLALALAFHLLSGACGSIGVSLSDVDGGESLMRDVVSAVGGAIGVLAGGVLLAVALYFLVVIGAVLLGVLLMMVLARAAARFMA